MKHSLRRALVSLTAVLVVSTAFAADHRDAPTIDDYSAIDINDVYMFRDTFDRSKIIISMTTWPLADPQFGPTYHFQPNALYRLNFTTSRDAHSTAHIDFNFGPFENGAPCPAPQVPCQVFEATFPNKATIRGLTTQGTYDATPLPAAIATSGDITVFAGPREDPLALDDLGLARSILSGRNQFTGVNSFAGKNVNAIVVRFPIEMVFPKGSCVGALTPLFSTPCGMWASTYLGREEKENGQGQPQNFRQLDRMGNPLVNDMMIPPALADAFNFAEPKDDAKTFGRVMADWIVALDRKFGTCRPGTAAPESCNPNLPFIQSLVIPETLKFAENLPDGYPNGRAPTDRATDILISLILQLPGFTDGTSAKPLCTAFPYLHPPLQVSDRAPFELVPQGCQ
jgi:Domain of unknown function (DUF4331)